MAARHGTYTYVKLKVVLAERKLTTYVYAVGWLYDMESIFRIYHIEAHLQVPLASRCLAVDARLWWMSLGEPVIPKRSWADFRALIIARYGPLPDEEANMPYRDPDIYNDMYMRRYLNYAAEWRAYPNESMGHYCRRDGLPLGVKQFVPAPIMGISLEDMIDAIMESEIIAYMVQVAAQEDDYLLVPVDDAGIPEPLFEGGLVLPKDPIPAVPLQEIPPQEAEANTDNNEVDPADFLAAPED
ncbi:hypothetical protein TIFTF001_029193 [Ficus carica]|uniref:Uncharacterized protein n=1 Tax=Ficus carica TaxID=3494 RepID=A0AA88DRY2_FICCA|nr:hypothetical protein TIFTF001_029193 [Ficus carica]